MKNYLALLIVFALLGLSVLAWQAGSDDSAASWQTPIVHASAESATVTLTPGWWETPVEKPVIPTMPGKKINATSTPLPENTAP